MAPDLGPDFNTVHAITCKAVRQVPESKRDFRPAPEMLTTFDLIFHMFSQEYVMFRACLTGRLKLEDFREIENAKADLHTIEQLAQYGEKVHSETSRWLADATRDELSGPIETFAGPSTRGKALQSALHHMLHHRGQLYVYLRLMGIEPIFVWTGEPIPIVRQKMARMAD
jgi:uncharacterized damage-inducible protein DinB